MKKLLEIRILILFAFLFVLPICANATDYYSDFTINIGDVYQFVNIYETGSSHITVDMLGGNVHSVSSNDSSTFNLFNGTIDLLTISDNSTANLYNGVITTLQSTDSGIANLYVLDYEIISLGVKGYTLSGHWEDETEFSIYLRGEYDSLPVAWHIVPEPSTLSLLGMFTLFMKKRKLFHKTKVVI